MGVGINAVKLRVAKIAQVKKLVIDKSAALSDPLDALRMTVITGLQGDRARGKPLTAPLQKILDDAESDARKVPAESLLVAADTIIADIDNVTDVDNDPRWPV